MNSSSLKSDDCAIQVEGLTKKFGSFTAVQDLSLQIPRGVIFGLLGPNGSGKSTTIKVLSGLLEPTIGKVWVDGHDLQADPMAVKRATGVLSEDMGLIELLSVQEHLLLACAAYGVARGEAELRSRKLLEYFDLWDARDRFPDQLSFGMSKKLSLAMALGHNPSVLFLDEPFEGLDPVFARCLRDLLVSLAGKGLTVFLTSHSLDLVEKMIHRFAILANGAMMYESSMTELRNTGTSLEDVFFRFVQPPCPQELEWIG